MTDRKKPGWAFWVCAVISLAGAVMLGVVIAFLVRHGIRAMFGAATLLFSIASLAAFVLPLRRVMRMRRSD
ncbi:MAG TPA: hypothetical protein VGM05_01120 [Planctomycetaceae bacterium]|jgi:hypothetical protein